jgi:signal transduction histidine kinase
MREMRLELAQIGRRTSLAAMSAAIAHEIKQPLGAIVANAAAGLRWLSKAPPSIEEAQETFQDIAAAGHRASEVIQSIRAMYSQGDHAGVPVDVNEIVRETIALVRSELEAANIAAKIELARELPPVSGHRGQLQQVILNLVTNAVDAMRAITDRPPVLRIGSRLVSDRVEVSVEDSGTGIQPEYTERIFEAFFTTKTSGMGMGLAICRSIVEVHRGTLSVAPCVPHGSVFRVTLPCLIPSID